ncbi:MAG: F0F1 ATP synthase subunit epsilon [Rhodobiaceae bacterium]|nr:F0F1 ATP synthase subunit epsilon [Rhodobiaceae bacterium]
MANFQFDLVSPERLLLSAEVEEVVVPGSEGEFGVLAEHTPIISTMRPGLVRVRGGEATSEAIYVAGGIAEFSNNQLTILAEHALPVSELDADKIAAEIKNVEEDIADAKDETVRAKAEIRLARLKASLPFANAR